MTTIETITNQQIQELSIAAGSAGDTETVELCEIALYGDRAERQAARAKCAKVISDAEAMDD